MLGIAMIAASLTASSGVGEDSKDLPIHIACVGEDKPICRAIARVLKRRGFVFPDTSGRRDVVVPRLTVRFEQHTETRFSLSGRLTWSDDSGQSGQSPEMSFSVSDAEISAGMLDRFAESLLTESGLFQSSPNSN